MGNLNFFDLNKYKKQNIFIETGTGKGLALDYASQFHFRELFSIQYNQVLFDEAKLKYSDKKDITIIKGPSHLLLRQLLSLLWLDEVAVFWLDAHLPGTDYGLAGPFDEKDPAIRMPLLKELEVIKKYRTGMQDVILIDDLRFYLKDDFQNGNLPDEFICEGYPEILDMFCKTHVIRKHLNHDGYLEITPT
jgi:hypothetical protein